MARSSPPLALRPHDVCVALQFALNPDTTFRELAEDVGLSVGEAHNASQRLEAARLLRPGRGPVNKRGLLEFVTSGVPYAFPPEIGQETRGIPTAHSGPVLSEFVDSVETIVWPSAKGSSRGLSLKPLCKGAPSMPEHNPRLYAWLTVIDALRVGRVREVQMAREYLENELLGRATE
jgi:DNA-binding Lrp family transcriptional regulator